MKICKKCGEAYKEDIVVCSNCYSTQFEENINKNQDYLNKINAKEKRNNIIKISIMLIYSLIMVAGIFLGFKNDTIYIGDLLFIILKSCFGFLLLFFTQKAFYIIFFFIIDFDKNKPQPTEIFLFFAKLYGFILLIKNLYNLYF